MFLSSLEFVESTIETAPLPWERREACVGVMEGCSWDVPASRDAFTAQAPQELHPPFPSASFPGSTKKPTKTVAFCGGTVILVFLPGAEAGDVLGSGLSSLNRAAWSTLRAPGSGEGGGTPGNEANKRLQSCS